MNVSAVCYLRIPTFLIMPIRKKFAYKKFMFNDYVSKLLSELAANRADIIEVDCFRMIGGSERIFGAFLTNKSCANMTAI